MKRYREEKERERERKRFYYVLSFFLRALSMSKVWGYEPHIKIIAEWEQWVKDW